MEKTKLFILGAGPHAKMVGSSVLKIERFELMAFVDPHAAPGSVLLGRPVRRELPASPALFIAAIGDNARRRQVFMDAKAAGLSPVAVTDPDAQIHPSVTIGSGAYLAPGCIVNIDAEIGENSIINTGAIVEHDGRIGAHAHIAPGVALAGSVTIGELTFMGIGSVVIDKLTVGAQVTVGAGGVVINDIADGLTVVGVPATRLLKKI